MQDFTRRKWLSIAAGCAAASGAAPLPCQAREQKLLMPAKGTRELFPVGPLSLKDFLTQAKEPGKTAHGLNLNEVVKALQSVELTIIDRRVWDGERWLFEDFGGDGFPKLAVSGTLTHKLQDNKENEYWAAIVDVEGLGPDTNNRSEPATRRFLVAIRARIWQTKGEGFLESALVANRTDRAIAYNILAQQLVQGKDGKWTPG
jgi:hypothetical protein